MSLLSHSFGTPSPGMFPRDVSLPDFVYTIYFYGRQHIVCDNDTRPNPTAVQRRKLIVSVAAACSKGITGKELMSFFSYFQAL